MPAPSFPRLTPGEGLSHPTLVVRLVARFAVVLLALVTASVNLAVCDGWRATAQARMACCADAFCAMHSAGHDRGADNLAVSQATADACCASSERQDAPPSAVYALPAIVVSAITFQVLDEPTPSRLLTWEIDAPPPDRSVPRHLFLSVFLV